MQRASEWEVGDAVASPTSLELAAIYVVRGFSPFPLRPRDKRPALTTWKRFQDVSLIDATPPDALDAYLYSWWGGGDHGIGLPTGAAFGLVVVDVDGDDGEDLVTETCGYWPDVPTVKTSKGFHLYFQHPGGDRPNRARIGGVGLDARGDRGFVVTAPSLHPSGDRYRWVRHNGSDHAWRDPFPEMPAALRTLCWPPERYKPVHRNPLEVSPRSPRYAATALRQEAEAVRIAPVGTRNHQLNTSAFRLARFIVSGDLSAAEIAYTLLAATSLPEFEARRTITSALNARDG